MPIRRFRQSSLVLLGCLLPLLAGVAFSGEPFSRITGLRVDEAGNILIDVAGEGFDPLLGLSPEADGRYRITLTAQHVRLAEGLQSQTAAFSQALGGKIPALGPISFREETVDGKPVVSIEMAAWRRLQPQVRENTGKTIVIALLGDRTLPPERLRALQQEEASRRKTEEAMIRLEAQKLADGRAREAQRLAPRLSPPGVKLTEKPLVHLPEQSQADSPAQPLKPPQPDLPVQPLKPAQADPPVQPLKPAQAESPVQPLKPSQADPPAQPLKPLQANFGVTNNNAVAPSAPPAPVQAPERISPEPPPDAPIQKPRTILDIVTSASSQPPVFQNVYRNATARKPSAASVMSSHAPVMSSSTPVGQPDTPMNTGSPPERSLPKLPAMDSAAPPAPELPQMNLPPLSPPGQSPADRMPAGPIHLKAPPPDFKPEPEMEALPQKPSPKPSPKLSRELELSPKLSPELPNNQPIRLSPGEQAQATTALPRPPRFWNASAAEKAKTGKLFVNAPPETLSTGPEGVLTDRNAMSARIMGEADPDRSGLSLATASPSPAAQDETVRLLLAELLVAPLAENRESAVANALINYGRLLGARNKPGQARALYAAAESLAGNDTDLLFNLGMTYVSLPDVPRARATLTQFLALAEKAALPAEPAIAAARNTRIAQARALLRQLEGNAALMPSTRRQQPEF